MRDHLFVATTCKPIPFLNVVLLLPLNSTICPNVGST